MNLKRDPAVLAGIIVAVIAALAAFVFEASPDLQALVNAASAAVAGAVVAVLVRSDRQLPLLTGAAGAVLALVVGFGIDLDSAQQASLMTVVSLVAGYAVRDRVDGPVPKQIEG